MAEVVARGVGFPFFRLCSGGVLGVGAVGVELGFGDWFFGLGIGCFGFVLLGFFFVVFFFEVVKVSLGAQAEGVFVDVDVSFFDGIEEVVGDGALGIGIVEGGRLFVVGLIGDGWCADCGRGR